MLEDINPMALVFLCMQEAGLSRWAICKDVGRLQPLRPSGVHVNTTGLCCVQCATGRTAVPSNQNCTTAFSR